MKFKDIVKKKNELSVLVRRIRVIKKIVNTCSYDLCKKYLTPSEATKDRDDLFDFEWFDLGGTVYNEDGKARLCENLTLYSKSGTPIKDIEL